MIEAGQHEVPGGYAVDAPTTDQGETIYFSLASLCDLVPPTAPDEPRAEKLIPALSEDDWRQIEFVPAENRPLIDRMLAALLEFRKARSVGSGFSGLYIRQEFPKSIGESGLTLSSLRAKLPSGTFIPAFRVASGGVTAQVVGGFAVRLPGLGWVYGREQSDRIQSLGFIIDQSPVEPSPSSVRELSDFLRSRELLLVDWYLITTAPESLESWVGRWKQGDTERELAPDGAAAEGVVRRPEALRIISGREAGDPFPRNDRRRVA